MDRKIEVTNLKNKEITYVNKKSKVTLAGKILKFFNKNNKINEKTSKNDVKKHEKSNFLSLLKNKQVKTILIVLFFGLFALIILNSSFGAEITNVNGSNSSLNYVSSLDYCEKLENKLVEVLSNIKGAGNVKVMVTVESGPKLNFASNVDQRNNTTTSGGNTTSNSTFVEEPIILNSSSGYAPLVVSEDSPKIQGVVVVASGAKDVGVKLNLLQAVMALLDVSSNNIQIYY